jgi:3-methyladenine DNA glycosylase AlkD
MNAREAQAKLRTLATPEAAKAAARFFKTGPGEYGEGDTFMGVRVPDIRKVAREFRTLPLTEIEILLTSHIHEERLLALLILVLSVNKCDDAHRKTAYNFYLKHTQYVNNWDLVDSSAPAIVGGYLWDHSRTPLTKLAKSKNLWERRIAIIATQHFIRRDELTDTIAIANLLLTDEEDLIHKAVGWMLREVGERDNAVLDKFLKQHAATMPRTMLRYAIEHYPADVRRVWMDAKHTAKSNRKS